MVLVGRDGEAWEVAASSLHLRPKGSTVDVPLTGRHGRNFARLAFEIPRRLPKAPASVVRQVWN